MESQQPARSKVNCDQEARITDRISDAVRMCSALHESRGVRANDRAYALARQGVIDGTAIEIIYVLGYDPCHENLPGPAIPDQGDAVA